MKLEKGAKIAVVNCPGPANGPFTAQYLDTFWEGLRMNGHDITGIYAVSGSSPTALMGCVRKTRELCDIWLNITSGDIVGDTSDLKSVTNLLKKVKERGSLIPRIRDVKSDYKDLKQAQGLLEKLKAGYAFSNIPLLKLIEKHCLPVIDQMFSPEAVLMKIGAVDYLTGQNVIFSNKIPEHKDLICLGTIGSMCLVPWFQSPPAIDNPVEKKLLDKAHPEFNSVWLVDGGYRNGLLLEEAIREPIGYDAIFIVDIHGLQFEEVRRTTPYNIAARLIRTNSILSTTNNQLMLSLVERINAGVEIRDTVLELKKKLQEARRLSSRPEDIEDAIKLVDEMIEQMNYGRLRLSDKRTQEIEIVSDPNPKHSVHFDFTDFSKGQTAVAQLMQKAHNAALKTLRKLGLSTKGIPLIKP